jgi:hypothetical protein
MTIYGFTSRSRIFHLYGDVTIAIEGLQNLDLCSALRAFEQGGIFVVPEVCDTGPRFFRSHPKDRKLKENAFKFLYHACRNFKSTMNMLLLEWEYEWYKY